MAIHHINGIAIETVPVFPPIEIRTKDWVAHEPDYDEGRPIGEGETEQDAINDLLGKLEH